MKSLRICLLPFLLILLFSTSFAQTVTNEELTEILGIKTWRVPLPTDKTMEWGIEIVDYSPLKTVGFEKIQKKFSQEKAFVALRDIDTDVYEFTLKQHQGVSKGKLSINLCLKDKNKNLPCDNNYAIDWNKEPEYFAGGTKSVIGNISSMLQQDKPVKQIILVLRKYRLN